VPIWKGPKTDQVLERDRESVDIGYCKAGLMRPAARGAWNRYFMMAQISKESRRAYWNSFRIHVGDCRSPCHFAPHYATIYHPALYQNTRRVNFGSAFDGNSWNKHSLYLPSVDTDSEVPLSNASSPFIGLQPVDQWIVLSTLDPDLPSHGYENGKGLF
jgi:hypothetical protein